MIPVFAVGRSQEVMIVLEQLMRMNEIPKVKVYLDGMIMEATAIHTAYPEYLNNQLRTQIFQRGENPFLSDIFVHIDNAEKREKLCDDPGPCIILATSGMLNGGPVMEYFKAMAPDRKNTFVFVGYQAEGTLGRKIKEGAKEVDIFGEKTPVLAKIKTIEGYSAHADKNGLFRWLYSIKSSAQMKEEHLLKKILEEKHERE